MPKSFRFHAVFFIGMCLMGIIVPQLPRHGMDQSNSQENLSSTTIPQGLGVTVPLIRTDLPYPALYNNTALLKEVADRVNADGFQQTRFPSIIGSYYAYFAFKALDPDACELYHESMTNYLLSCLDPLTYTFRDTVDYALVQEISPKGALLARFPWTPALSHHMALLILADMGPLPFNSYYITMWIQQIKAMQQVNGGFSTLYANGTLMETYFALATLKALYQNSEDFLTTEEKATIVTFIRNSQRSASWAPGIYGVFNEYSLDAMVGWEYFLSSWYAVSILDLIGETPADIISNFRTFLTTYNIYNTNTHTFYSLWNERTHPEVAYYYGTALIGECVRILGITDYNTTLLQNTLMEGMTDSSACDVTYFAVKDTSVVMDLSASYYISRYLASGSVLANLQNTNYTLWSQLRETLAKYFIPSGGAAYYPSMPNALPSVSDFLYYHTMATIPAWKEGIDESEVLSTYIDRAIGNRFVDVNLSATLFTTSLLYDLSSDDFNPAETDYYALQVLDDYNLMEVFALTVGEDYALYEAYPRTLWMDNGRFRNSSLSLIRGDLRSTYGALKSQEILIDHHANQTFATYYNTTEWNYIHAYLQSFYAIANENLTLLDLEAWISPIERLYYLLGLNSLFELNLTAILCQDYVSALEIGSLSEREKYWLCRMIIEYELEIPDIATQLYTHADVQFYLTKVLQEDTFDTYVSTLLYLTHPCFAFFAIYAQYPQVQKYGSAYVYQFQFASHLSLESVSDFRITTEITTFTTSFENQIYWATIYPYFNPTHPYTYSLRLQFTWNEKFFDQIYSVPIQIETNVNHTFFLMDRSLSLIIDLPMELALHLLPTLTIRLNETIINTYSSSQLTRILGETRTTYGIALTNYQGGNYSFTVSFGVIWMETYAGMFEMPALPDPPPTTTTTTTNTTTSTDTTTTTTTNTTTSTDTTTTTTTDTITATNTTTTDSTSSNTTNTPIQTTSESSSSSNSTFPPIRNDNGRIIRTSVFATGGVTFLNTALLLLKKKMKFSHLH